MQKNIIKLGPCHLDTSLRLSPLLRKFVQKNFIKIGPCHLEWGKKMVSPSARDPGSYKAIFNKSYRYFLMLESYENTLYATKKNFVDEYKNK